MIRVLVVDGQELVRIAIRNVLAEYRDIHIAAEAVDGETAIRLNREVRPDVVILDINLPGLSGFEITRRLKKSRSRLSVIVLSVLEQPPFPEQMLEAGASAYLTKDCASSELVEAIRTVASGGRHIAASIAQQIALDALPGKAKTPFDGLSAREMEVMLMLTDGKRINEIADAMHLSPKTIATYKYRIFDKLNTHSDVQMTRMALRYGVVAPV